MADAHQDLDAEEARRGTVASVADARRRAPRPGAGVRSQGSQGQTQAAKPKPRDARAALGLPKKSAARAWVGRALVLGLIGALGFGAYTFRERSKAAAAPRYRTVQVEKGSLAVTVTATGKLEARDTVQVGSEITGKVLKVLVDFNDPVKEGQVLAEIDTEQLAARVEESEAQQKSAAASVKTAQATVVETRQKAVRSRELRARGLISAQDLEAAEAALARAEAQAIASSAQSTVSGASLKSARTQLSRAIIKSPIDGIVLVRSVEVGTTVTAGFQTPVLFTLAKDLKKMDLKVAIDEADVGGVREGQKATFTVDAFPKRKFESEVVSLRSSPKEGTTVVTYEAVLTVDNRDGVLRPGMTATALVTTEQKTDVLVVPNAALRFQPNAATSATSQAVQIPGFGAPQRPGGNRPPRPSGGGPQEERVFVLEAGQPKRVAIKIGASDGRRTEISGPEIKEGTEVVVETLAGAP